MDTWNIVTTKLDVPNHEEVADVLNQTLIEHYAEVDVSVVECPDLREPPYSSIAAGLSGKTCIIDIGGVDNLFPKVKLVKEYCLAQISAALKYENPNFLGAGSCGYSIIGQNSELVCNCTDTRFLSTCAKMSADHTKVIVSPYKSSRVSALANVFCCRGDAGKVLRVHVRRRIGAVGDFIAVLQSALRKKYGDHPVSLGGVFVMRRGCAKIHVMSDFTEQPIRTQKFIDEEWLKYVDGNAPMTFRTVCTSVDPGQNMRLTHTHGEALDGSVAGHYHYDYEREEVEYEGFFNLAEAIHRVDNVPQAPDFQRVIDFPTNTYSQPGTPIPSNL